MAPLCIHGQPWKTCPICARHAWCEDCGELVLEDAPLHPRETITCSRCVDRMIGRPVGAAPDHRLARLVECAVDAALGEVHRQVGDMGHVLLEARGAGISYGRLLINALSPES